MVVVVDRRHDALEFKRSADKARKDVHLIVVRQAEEDVRVLGIELPEDVRPTAIAV